MQAPIPGSNTEGHSSMKQHALTLSAEGSSDGGVDNFDGAHLYVQGTATV